MPYRVLQLRGTVRRELVDGIAPEYEAMILKSLGAEGGRAWLENLRPICPQMVRLSIRPDWVAVLDFEQRFPSAFERAMERTGVG